MRFFIKQHSTLPYLEIELEEISKKYNIANQEWENCAVTFSMYDKKNNIYRIANKEGKLVVKERVINLGDPYNYFLRYEFTENDTSTIGDFIGEFKVDFLNDHNMGKITIPIDEKIEIFIKDSITRTTVIG
jgi:hypothetical protein